MNYCHISGMGYYLPKKILTNQDLEKMVDTSDKWIKQRTGIERRHISNENELPSDMALKASLKAFEQSQLKPEDLDFILIATLYPDQIMPNTACKLQKKLNISHIPCLDISSACSGFMYGLSIADQYIQTGTYKNILLVGTETLHHVTDYKDRSTCILFGDGAGAFLLSQNKDPKTGGRVFYQELKAYGELGSALFISAPGAKHSAKKDNYSSSEGTPSEDKAEPYIQMDGQTVFKKAVQIMCESYKNALNKTSFSPEQIDWIVPHQANERILKKFSKLVNFPEEKVIFDIKETGNTSSASIPLSMARAVEKGKIKRGQNILMLAVGGGMTSGAVLLRY